MLRSANTEEIKCSHCANLIFVPNVSPDSLWGEQKLFALISFIAIWYCRLIIKWLNSTFSSSSACVKLTKTYPTWDVKIGCLQITMLVWLQIPHSCCQLSSFLGIAKYMQKQCPTRSSLQLRNKNFFLLILCFVTRTRIFSFNLVLRDENENQDMTILARIFKD